MYVDISVALCSILLSRRGVGRGVGRAKSIGVRKLRVISSVRAFHAGASKGSLRDVGAYQH
jgi:hypothetical protein